MLSKAFDNIDEAFLNLQGFENRDIKEYCQTIRRKTTQGTGIPISIGGGTTKTLAKVANRFAKKYSGYEGVCLIDTEEKRVKALKLTKIGDVWGIGDEYEDLLSKYGVRNAYEFSQLPQKFVRQQMTVVGEKMWMELNGIPCFEFELEPVPKKQLRVSRSFGEKVCDLDNILSAVATYASLCAERLRKQRSCAVSMVVSLYNCGSFNSCESLFIQLPVPTDSTLEISNYALKGARKLYKKDTYYFKAEVGIAKIVSNKAIQLNLLDKVDREKHSRLMKIMDKVNFGFNQRVIRLAVEDGTNDWKLLQEFRSRCYTTDINDIIEIWG